MKFAVIHVQKGGSTSGGLGRHIDRKVTPINAKAELAKFNFSLKSEVCVDGKIRLAQVDMRTLKSLSFRVNERVKLGYKGATAIRKDAVKQLNIMLTGSHEVMSVMSRQELYKWSIENYRFLVKEYGIDNIVGFAVHCDERTPHIHATVVPLTKDGRLSAKEVVGNRTKLTKLQTNYANQMESFGLERGLKGSKVSHVTTAEYYQALTHMQTITEQIIPPREEVTLTQPLKLSPPPTNPLKHSKWLAEEQKKIDNCITKVADQIEEQTEINKNIDAKTKSMFFKTMEVLQLSKDIKSVVELAPSNSQSGSSLRFFSNDYSGLVLNRKKRKKEKKI